ncbi:T9SS type A sorting domain-containing protein [Tamlana sp. 2_MG-2023]|uniref:T9SS type A sorting domain-containing protein n=1 Tax=unclassified Tamlana TaxID=2614803 RepID=UPI0026E48986|nr:MULTISPECIES: T9SS type A sorting domain-containing protein [unclassified Tamlana]MDO6760466.1 T9SS type A sorting domain-containing protein [Tamlana sp. 2_MG-2023]MDO6790722.1 T9SS type A sorting domain-containing protein [Tamlana sp. 1_MG-2023]
MKSKLQFLIALLLVSTLTQAQEQTANLSMGADYTNQVFYKLNTGTASSFGKDSWDIAFLRNDARNIAVRANEGRGITVFEASNDINDWATINVTNEASWTELHNSNTAWTNGAFDNGSASFGWGEYNPINHHVTGSIIFALKYADGTYRKLIIEDYYGGYTIRFSTWDATTSTWSADQSATIANANNPDNSFNYYSLENATEVVAEPATSAWDFVFTKYAIDYYGDGSLYYPVTGVLHNSTVSVAKNDEPTRATNPSLTYSTDINTIGHDWKTLNASYTYDANSNQAYYVKYADGTVYRMYFTAFAGSSSGDVTFKFKDVTSTLSIDQVSEGVSFGIYPNPSTDKIINLIYDVNALSSSNNNLAVYATTGQKVFETTLNSNAGFYNKTLDLSSLNSGMYVIQFNSGTTSIAKKLILK